jgi:hypothetical protein
MASPRLFRKVTFSANDTGGNLSFLVFSPTKHFFACF